KELSDKIVEIIEKHKFEKMHSIGVLQDLQEVENWLPREALEDIAKKLNIPVSQVYSIAVFYKAFSLKPRGKHMCVTCLGTACHVRGGQKLLEKLERDLNIKAGETTPDMMFTLETVRCVGACALAPVVIADGEYHSQMTNIKVDKLLKDVKKKDEENKRDSP
ncbi:MAG: NAD(P)H-dependent oxidoreductase subunit E, partial [Elusimicrobiota bacterium]